jgi:hypothetical protein
MISRYEDGCDLGWMERANKEWAAHRCVAHSQPDLGHVEETTVEENSLRYLGSGMSHRTTTAMANTPNCYPWMPGRC